MGPFFQDLVVTLVAALVVLLPSRRLRVPPAVGFMITGVLIGPAAFRLVQDPHDVEVLAEVGVSVLLFLVGLEFSLARLREIGRAFLLAGPLQVGGTILLAAAALLVLPIQASARAAIFAGMLVALSSTAMLFQLMRERGETGTPQGRLLVGILIFQDLAIIPMLALVPALAAAGGVALGPRLLGGLAGAAGVFLIARFLMPRIVGAVIRSGVRELYVMMAVAVCLGAALGTQSLGLSRALGAFLAGILVSESEYAHQIVAEILPFGDLFASLFFVSIGMLLDPRFIVDHLREVGGLLLLVFVGKAAIASAVVRLLGFPLRIAFLVGIPLAQVGEFSFVLASVGRERGLLGPEQHQLFLAVAVLSLILTPFLSRGAAWAANRVGGAVRRAPPPARGDRAAPDLIGAAAEAAAAVAGHGTPAEGARRQGHVLIVGYGLNGRNLARVLRTTGIPYTVLEVDASIVRRARREGEEIHFGDASRREALLRCRVGEAAVVVLAISDRAATRAAVTLTRQINPAATIIARTRLVSEVPELQRRGADDVVPEEFETSIAIFSRVLRHFHVPGNIVRLQESALRREGYGFLRGGTSQDALRASISRMIAGAITETYYVQPESPAVGQSLSQLDLRGRTRALVIAAVREGKHYVSPEPTFTFEPGDILVLVGDHAALDAAFELLDPPEPGGAS
jgi:CPA2 family monovalent cation:H+ antiporter-2